MPVLNPNFLPAKLDYQTSTKAELAELVNQQTKELQAALLDKRMVMTLLCAIIKHPDAYSVDAQGRATLEVQAVSELAENTRISQYRSGDHLILKVSESTYILHAEPMRLGFSVQELR